MAITITATAGSASANSFITEAEYIAFLATRLNVPSGSTVTGSTCSEDEKKAMIEATRDLTALGYIGQRTDTTQVLAWPRAWAENPDAPTILTDPNVFIQIGTQIVYYADDEIPTRVKNATCELAMEYTKAGTTDVAKPDDALALTRLVAGPIELDFADPAKRVQGLSRYPRVLDNLAPLLAGGSLAGLEVVRT